MLTREQKIMLENKIYSLIKKRLTEWKDKDEKGGDDDAMMEKKRKTVLDRLEDDSVNQAQIAYEVYGSEGPEEEAADRSKFYKKQHGRKNDNGVPYEFSNTEINKIDSALNNINN